MKKSTRILCLVTVLLFGLSLLLIIGTDTDWGKIEVTRMTLTTPDGDEISALLYKPYSATPENPAPCVLYCHGGNDMLEQGSSYAVELARRGYVFVSWDYSNCARSDIATGTSETAADPISGAPTMGGETVWNTIKTYNFIDHSKIITSGHSMGGQYSMGLAIKHQQEVFLQVNLGMNFYGTFGNDIFNSTRQHYSGLNGQNVLEGTFDKAWHGEGTSNDIPRLSVSDNNRNYGRVSDFYVEDGSYMRCKQIQLGYTLPKKGFFKDHVLRFYLTAQNPFTITGYSGMDPERPAYDGSVIETGIDNIAYPSPRTFLFGLDFNF